MRHHPALFLCLLLLGCYAPGLAQQRDVDAVIRKLIAQLAARLTHPQPTEPVDPIFNPHPRLNSANPLILKIMILRFPLLAP